LAYQRLRFFLCDHPSCRLHGRLFNEAVSVLVIPEQRLHVSPHFFIACASFVKKGFALALSQLERRLTNLLDLLPTSVMAQ